MPPNPRVFISSTVLDLLDVRASIRIQLEQSFGLTVFQSECSDFPAPVSCSAPDACIAVLSRCDLVILIIDKRYGYVTSRVAGVPISVTRSEYRAARERRIVTMVFVRANVQRELADLNSLRVSDAGLADAGYDSLFATLKSRGHLPYVDDAAVLEFASECFRTGGEFVTTFETSADIHRAIDARLPSFLGDHFRSVLPTLDAATIAEIPRELDELNDASCEYRAANQVAFDAARAVRAEFRVWPHLILPVQRVLERNADTYSARMTSRIRDRRSERTARARLVVFDTSMELLQSESWLSNPYHVRVAERTRAAAHSERFSASAYSRTIVLSNPAGFLSNDSAMRCLRFVARFHHDTGVALRIAAAARVAPGHPARALNFYLVPGAVVALIDFVLGVAFEITPANGRNILRTYEGLAETVNELCEREEGGFVLRSGMPWPHVRKRIAGLA